MGFEPLALAPILMRESCYDGGTLLYCAPRRIRHLLGTLLTEYGAAEIRVEGLKAATGEKAQAQRNSACRSRLHQPASPFVDARLFYSMMTAPPDLLTRPAKKLRKPKRWHMNQAS
jgi:hypothetical protein